MNNKLSTPKGFFDRAPEEAERISAAQEILFDLASRYGAQELKVSPMGFEETFFGDTNLDADKTYQLTDKSNRTLIMNCDSLPAVLRAYISSNRDKLARFMFSIPVFRYRNTKLRYYHHLGVTNINGQIADRSEILIPSILIETLKNVTSKKINIVMNEYRLWISVFQKHGFSETEARNYFFYRRFYHEKDKACDEKLIDLVERIEATPALQEAIDFLHNSESREFTEQRQHLSNSPVGDMMSQLEPYYDRIEKLSEFPNVQSCKFTPNDFHSSEFFSAIGYQLLVDGESKRIADGGSYHEYGRKFDSRIKSVYSGIIRHEDLLDHDDLLENPRPSVGIFLKTANHEQIEVLLGTLRNAGLRVLEDASSKGIKQASAYFKKEAFDYFIVVGDREFESGNVAVTNLKTQEDTQSSINSLPSALLRS